MISRANHFSRRPYAEAPLHPLAKTVLVLLFSTVFLALVVLTGSNSEGSAATKKAKPESAAPAVKNIPNRQNFS